MQCLTPPLSKKPAGEWLCPECKEEADLEARAAAEREAKSRKCCACGARGEEASVHALLASAWAGAVLELGPAPVGKFALCEKCAHRHEAVWRHGIVRVRGHVRVACMRQPECVLAGAARPLCRAQVPPRPSWAHPSLVAFALATAAR